MLRKYKFHFLLIFIGLIWIHVFDFLTQTSAQHMFYPDSNSYLESARNLYIFHRGHNFRPMLMAMITGFPYIFGASDGGVVAFSYFVNLFCWLGLSLVIYEISSEFLQRKWAFLMGLSTLFFIGLATCVFHLLTENIYLFFISCGFYILAQYFKTQSFRYLAAAIGIFILSMLIKPGSTFLAIVFILFFIKEILQNYKSKFAWFMYGSLLMVFVQCAGVKYQFGNFKISYIDSMAWYNYIGTRSKMLQDGKDYKPRIDLFLVECKKAKVIASDDMKQQLKTNTANVFIAYFQDVFENGTTGNTVILECKNVENNAYFEWFNRFIFLVSKAQNILFTVCGALLGIYYVSRIRREKLFGLMGIFIGYIIATSGVSYSQGDRFHLMIFPFALLLLAKFLKDKSKIFD